MRVAMRRAAHQVFDVPKVLDDPLALLIAGEAAETIQAAADQHQSRFGKNMRAFLVARSRFAEEQLARGLAAGVEQYLILGAGLDTSAYRGAVAESGVRAFEVDHPATQAWKEHRLADSENCDCKKCSARGGRL
jgi:methyltransferase (TIGR00027 family)